MPHLVGSSKVRLVRWYREDERAASRLVQEREDGAASMWLCCEARLPHVLIVLTLSVFRSLPLLSDLRGTLSGARSQAPRPCNCRNALLG